MPCLPVNKTMGDKVVRDWFPYRTKAADMKEADIKRSPTSEGNTENLAEHQSGRGDALRERKAPQPPTAKQAIQLAVWMLSCIII